MNIPEPPERPEPLERRPPERPESPERGSHRPSPRGPLLAEAIAVVLGFTLLVHLSRFLPIAPDEEISIVGAVVATVILSSLIVALALTAARRPRVRLRQLRGDLPWRDLLALTVKGALVLLLVYVASGLFLLPWAGEWTLDLPGDVPERDLRAALPGAFRETPLLFGFLVVAGAALEELIYRGWGVVLVHLAWPRATPWAVALSALLFGVTHSITDLAIALHYSALGLVFAWLAARSRSVVPPLLLHVANNAVVFLLILLLGAAVRV